LYPDFIGIGAQKAATTWLDHNLQAHPQIWVPPIKELHYFNDRINDPSNVALRLYRRVFVGKSAPERRWRSLGKARFKRHLKRFSKEDFLWDLKYYAGTPNDDWYASLFEPGRGNVVGEICPAYSMLEPDVVARVHELMPQAKLVFVMRNPIERAWSQVVMEFGTERAWSQAAMEFGNTENQVIDAMAEGKIRRFLQSEDSRLRTNYLRTLDNWGTFYPEEQIFVGFFEDVHFFPEELLRRLYGFLGVDPSFKPPHLDKKVSVRSTGTAPTGALGYLAQVYRDEIGQLHELFGGYTSFWLYCTERLIEKLPPDKRIPFPLWESLLWSEWESSGQPRLQSGPLSSVQLAS